MASASAVLRDPPTRWSMLQPSWAFSGRSMAHLSDGNNALIYALGILDSSLDRLAWLPKVHLHSLRAFPTYDAMAIAAALGQTQLTEQRP